MNKIDRNLIILIVFLAMVAFSLGIYSNRPGPAKVNNIIPNLIPQAKHKWIILNYWASWCLPCHQEIPELNAFYKKHKNKDAIVVGVNFEKVNAKQLQQLITKMHIEFPNLNQDPAKTLGLSKINVLPTTFIISPDGKIIKTLLGKQTQQTLETVLWVSTHDT